MQQQNQGQSTLQNVYHKSFPGTSLFEISLVKDTDPNLPFYKNRYFFFVSMTPGVKTDTGGKSFDKNGRVNLKTEVEKLSALGKSLRAFARGQGQKFGQFAIFTDSGKSEYGSGGIKSCFVSEYIQNEKRSITLSCKSGQNKPFGIFMTSPEAEAMADIFDLIIKKAIDLEFEHNVLGVSTPTHKPAPMPMNQPAPPMQQPQQNFQQNNVADNFANAMMLEQPVMSEPYIEENPF